MSKKKITVKIEGVASTDKDRVFKRVLETLKKAKGIKVYGFSNDGKRMGKEESARAKAANVFVISRQKYDRKKTKKKKAA